MSRLLQIWQLSNQRKPSARVFTGGNFSAAARFTVDTREAEALGNHGLDFSLVGTVTLGHLASSQLQLKQGMTISVNGLFTSRGLLNYWCQPNYYQLDFGGRAIAFSCFTTQVWLAQPFLCSQERVICWPGDRSASTQRLHSGNSVHTTFYLWEWCPKNRTSSGSFWIADFSTSTLRAALSNRKVLRLFLIRLSGEIIWSLWIWRQVFTTLRSTHFFASTFVSLGETRLTVGTSCPLAWNLPHTSSTRCWGLWCSTFARCKSAIAFLSMTLFLCWKNSVLRISWILLCTSCMIAAGTSTGEKVTWLLLLHVTLLVSLFSVIIRCIRGHGLQCKQRNSESCASSCVLCWTTHISSRVDWLALQVSASPCVMLSYPQNFSCRMCIACWVREQVGILCLNWMQQPEETWSGGWTSQLCGMELNLYHIPSRLRYGQMPVKLVGEDGTRPTIAPALGHRMSNSVPATTGSCWQFTEFYCLLGTSWQVIPYRCSATILRPISTTWVAKSWPCLPWCKMFLCTAKHIRSSWWQNISRGRKMCLRTGFPGLWLITSLPFIHGCSISSTPCGVHTLWTGSPQNSSTKFPDTIHFTWTLEQRQSTPSPNLGRPKTILSMCHSFFWTVLCAKSNRINALPQWSLPDGKVDPGFYSSRRCPWPPLWGCPIVGQYFWEILWRIHVAIQSGSFLHGEYVAKTPECPGMESWDCTQDDKISCHKYLAELQSSDSSISSVLWCVFLWLEVFYSGFT